MVAEAERVLREVFGLHAFRPGQGEVVEAMLDGRDVLSVAPTGSGKSISYWVPAVVDGGLTLVVSPLIALMKDQVDRLTDRGVAATFVNSSVTSFEQRERLRRALDGEYRLLFLAPERLARPGFIDQLAELRIGRIVVDEAHCISTWGHDFRPDYRLLSGAIAACGRPPVAGFTATATPQVRADIASSLQLRDPFISVSGFNRPTLTLAVIRCRGERAKRDQLRSLLATPGQQALVYVGTVSAAEARAAELRECRHPRIADYFGEEGVARRCHACDNCLTASPPEEPVAAEAVQAALAATARFSGRVGLANVAAVLGGRRTKWSSAQPWVQELPFHGALNRWKEERIRLLLSGLINAGLARQSSGEYPVVEITPAGRDALAGTTTPSVTLPAESKSARSGDVPVETLDRLRHWRLETARAAGVPAYVVFHDATLAAIASARPTSLADLLRVSGVGESKLRRYGDEVLEVLRTTPA